MPGRWTDSTRNARLPRNWPALRAAVLLRDGGQCTAVEHGQRCTERGTDVDHVQPSGADTPDNLASLCAWHHGRKTAREGNAARTRQRRDAEQHPGMIE